jgi:hypothetical protein
MSDDTVDRRERDEHLSEDEVVAFLAHELRGKGLRAAERHLAVCDECRDELVAVNEILAPRRSDRAIPWRVLVPTAAAAAVALLALAGPLRERVRELEPRHRDAPSQIAQVPTPVAPLGAVERVDHLLWRTVAGADQYRLTLFDADAAVLWRTTTSDTIAALPDSVPLSPGARYLWRLEARVGWDLWEESDLVEFTIARRGATP